MLLALSLRAQLERDGLQVVGIALNGHKAVELCRQTHPDAVLMDLRMPFMGGLEATRLIMAECPAHVIILTAADSPAVIAEALAAGAAACLIKPAMPEDVVSAVKGCCGPRS